MDLSTSYLGFDLPHPFIPGASPLSGEIDTIKQLEDAGAAAIILHSLFEEQINSEEVAATQAVETPAEQFAEALTYFPSPEEYKLGPDEYLEHVRKAKEAVDVPVIASLNGTTLGGWLDYAQQMAEAGADALELNVYLIATDPDTAAEQIERETIEMVGAVKEKVNIPVAVKLSPFYSSMPNFARHLDNVATDGLVIFNRFYQPDIDVEELEVVRYLNLSNSSELLLRLRWLAILFGQTQMSLACTGGVHCGLDALKACMCGASAVQIVSALLERGPGHLATIRKEVEEWLEEHEYDSLNQAIGSMSLLRCPDAAAYERANYMHILQSWESSGPSSPHLGPPMSS